jgi:peroxiredoxin
VRDLVVLVVVIVLVIGAWQLLPEPAPMPDVRFDMLDGRQIDSRTLRGRPVLVHFWAIDCGVCERDFPRLESLSRDLKDRELMVIGIAPASDPPAAVADFVSQTSVAYPVSRDVHGEIGRAFGDVTTIPTTFLIDPAGRIRYAASGPIDETRIRALVATF